MLCLNQLPAHLFWHEALWYSIGVAADLHHLHSLPSWVNTGLMLTEPAYG